MELTTSQFAQVEAAYRGERIAASFRDHAAGRRHRLFRSRRRPATTHGAPRTLRAA